MLSDSSLFRDGASGSRATPAGVAAGAAADDFVLMEAIARRNPAGLEALYDRHGGLVYSLCRKILHGDAAAAEEVLVDVFWELWDRCDRYDATRGSPVNYLATVARSRALDRLRSNQSAARRVEQAASDRIDAAAAPTAQAALDDALAVERRKQVLAALARLEPGQRQAIELAYFEGLSQREVAERMNRPLGTVKTWTRDGLIRLRDHLRSKM
jgi:RNA polymerase sigma-70 factor (ECF subfamily)